MLKILTEISITVTEVVVEVKKGGITSGVLARGDSKSDVYQTDVPYPEAAQRYTSITKHLKDVLPEATRGRE